MKQLEEIAIEGKTKDFVAILDRPTADNTFVYQMGNENVSENGQKIKFSDANLEAIARHAIENVADSINYSTITQVAKNIFVYTSSYDYTIPNFATNTLSNNDIEVYMMIPNGARINNKDYQQRTVERIILKPYEEQDFEIFAKILREYGFTNNQAAQIYKPFVKDFQVPSKKGLWNIYQK